MAKGVTVKVEGFGELEKALSELPRATAKNVARRALLRAGQPVADHAKRLVPVDSGGLRDSIVVTTKTANKPGAGAFAAAMKGGATRAEAGQAMRAAAKGGRSGVEVYIGAGQLPHAHLVEFGSVNNSPQPYLRPAWDAGKQKVLDDIRDFLGQEISKAAQRAARKALKAKA